MKKCHEKELARFSCELARRFIYSHFLDVSVPNGERRISCSRPGFMLILQQTILSIIIAANETDLTQDSNSQKLLRTLGLRYITEEQTGIKGWEKDGLSELVFGEGPNFYSDKKNRGLPEEMARK